MAKCEAKVSSVWMIFILAIGAKSHQSLFLPLGCTLRQLVWLYFRPLNLADLTCS